LTLSLDLLRWLSVRAIRGRTWALDRVFDSPSTPADIRTETEREPFIAVFVDNADYEVGDFPGIMLPRNADIQLVIECGVASPQRFTDEGDPVELDVPDPRGTFTVTQLNATDAGLEAQIGFLTRQALQALLSTSDSNPWSELWHHYTAHQLAKIDYRRGGPATTEQTTAVRYASRITCLHFSTLLAEPPRGADLNDYPFWSGAIAAFKADEEYAELGQLLEMHIINPTGPLPDWRLAQKLMNLPKVAVRAIGIAPIHAPVFQAGDAGFPEPTTPPITITNVNDPTLPPWQPAEP
jgi:hypothetical protein